MRSRNGLLVLLAVGLMNFLLGGCRKGEEAAQESARSDSAADAGGTVPPLAPHVVAALPVGMSADMVRDGRRLFGSVCAVCHGPTGEGTQLAPSLRDAEWIHGSGEAGEIADLIRGGVAKPERYPVPMPPLGGGAFGEDEVRALSAYVYALRLGAS